MRVLVAGGTGMIGHRFAELLLARESTSGIDAVRIAGRNRDAAADLVDAGAEFVAGDLTDPDFARSATEGMNAVVHAAGRSGLGGPLRLYQVNIDITAALLDAARRAGAGRFVHIGSPSMYFDRTNRLDRAEDYRPERLPDGYTQSKAAADRMVLDANSADFTTISLRPRFVTGHGDNYLLTRFIALRRAGILRRIGRGGNLADFTAASNQADAMLLALKAPDAACGEAYNITNGAPVELWRFLDEVMVRIGLKPIRRSIPYPLAAFNGLVMEGLFAFSNRAPGLSRLSAQVLSSSMTLSIEKARARLGYAPRQSNAGMLEEFARWYQASRRRTPGLRPR